MTGSQPCLDDVLEMHIEAFGARLGWTHCPCFDGAKLAHSYIPWETTPSFDFMVMNV